ncbi:hypothetical protein GCM10010170_057260 [Dactylosporangium salmoneum]|uniref:Uncharacterized protein n=1 Tax=Dactylosporangium salmoneum TaxID=53361 RepID=A0ABN3GV20_9ACTN
MGALLFMESVCCVSPGLITLPSRNTVRLEPCRAYRREATWHTDPKRSQSSTAFSVQHRVDDQVVPVRMAALIEGAAARDQP